MLSVTVKYKDNKYVYPNGISLLDISKDFQKEFKEKIIIARVNGLITELNQKIFNSCTVEFQDRTSVIGNKVYESGLLFILIKAFKDVYSSRIRVEHSIDKGVYISTDIRINESKIEKVKK